VSLKPEAIIFDAYGTLFNVHSVIRNSGVGIPGDLEALSQLWRRKQLEYTWLRSLMDRYEDFWHITEAALRAAVRQLSTQLTDRQVERLMQAYLAPAVFPEVVSALEGVNGLPLAILSNGSPAMLDAAVCSNSLGSYFAEIISVDRVKNLQTLSPCLCARIGDTEPSSGEYSFRFFQPMGRCRSQSLRLPGLLVQPVWSGDRRLGICPRFYCVPTGSNRRDLERTTSALSPPDTIDRGYTAQPYPGPFSTPLRR